MKKIIITGLAVLALSGCTVQGQAVHPSSEATHTDIEVWRGQARDDMVKVSSALNGIQTAASSNDVIGLRESCTGLANRLDDAYKWVVTPRGDLSTELRAAFDSYKNAARVCSHLVTTQDVEDTAEHLKEGTEHMDKVNAILGNKTA